MTVILLAVLLLTTCGLAVSLYLAYSVKRQAWEADCEAQVREAQISESLASLKENFEALGRRFDELEQRTGVLVAPGPTISGLNLTRRVQALRMLARGEQSDKIAAALNLPRAEIALLVKVRRLAG